MSFVVPRHVVFSRSTAWLLIALVTVPFTAPFTTCDLSMLLSVVSHAPSRVAVNHGERSTSLEETGTQGATASVLEEEQFKDTMLTAAVTIAPTSAHARSVLGTVQRAFAHRLPLLALRL